MKVAIVEDNRKTSEKLKSFLQEYQREINESIEVICYYDGMNFVEEYSADYDIVFMDIGMPLLDGVGASRILREKDPEVDLIFTSAMSQYAAFGYDVDAAAFLVKPVNELVLRNKLQKIIERRRRTQKSYFVFSDVNGHSKIFYRDIMYVESSDHYCIFHTRGKEYRKLVSLREVETVLKDHGFLRSSNSFLINASYVTSWKKDKVTVNDIEIPVSRARRKEFLNELTKMFGGQY